MTNRVYNFFVVLLALCFIGFSVYCFADYTQYKMMDTLLYAVIGVATSIFSLLQLRGGEKNEKDTV